MSDILTKYDEIKDFLYFISSEIRSRYNFKLTIEIMNNLDFNAIVKNVNENEYIITIFSGCFNLDYKIGEITRRYTEDDLKFFWRLKPICIFNNQEQNDYRDKLNDLFSTVILLHVFFHECGHIIARHIERFMGEYVEYDSSEPGNLYFQEHEIVADWLSTKYLYPLIYHTVVKGKKMEKEEIISVFTQITVLYWLSLTIEFQIFDSQHDVEFEVYKNKKHPHPAVRLYSSLEAMRESMADIIIVECGVSEDEAEKYTDEIISGFYIIIQSFLQITETPIDIKKNEAKVVDYYICLREIPYNNDIKNDQCIHLAKLAEEYKEMWESIRKSVCHNEL